MTVKTIHVTNEQHATLQAQGQIVLEQTIELKQPVPADAVFARTDGEWFVFERGAQKYERRGSWPGIGQAAQVVDETGGSPISVKLNRASATTVSRGPARRRQHVMRMRGSFSVVAASPTTAGADRTGSRA